MTCKPETGPCDSRQGPEFFLHLPTRASSVPGHMTVVGADGQMHPAQALRSLFPRLAGTQGSTATWTVLSISLSKATDSLRDSFCPETSWRHRQGFSPLKERHPSRCPSPSLQTTPNKGCFCSSCSRHLSQPCLQDWAHRPRVAQPLTETYCVKLTPQVCLLPSGSF